MLYGIPTYVLIIAMLVVLGPIVINGLRHGQRRSAATSESARIHIRSLQGSLMGLLALLLGFNFSLALGRFDDRAQEEVAEANAIGTAWLRTDLLQGTSRDDLREALADYAQSRLIASFIPEDANDAHAAEVRHSDAAFVRAWATATEAARARPDPATVAVVASLNDMTDSFSSREAAKNRHVPQPVIVLMIAVMLFQGWLMGYAVGIAGIGLPLPVIATVVLILGLLALIIDVDRPGRGIIRTDQSSMIATVDGILSEMGRPIPAVK